MTVQELINYLLTVEDKSIPACIGKTENTELVIEDIISMSVVPAIRLDENGQQDTEKQSILLII